MRLTETMVRSGSTASGWISKRTGSAMLSKSLVSFPMGPSDHCRIGIEVETSS